MISINTFYKKDFLVRMNAITAMWKQGDGGSGQSVECWIIVDGKEVMLENETEYDRIKTFVL